MPARPHDFGTWSPTIALDRLGDRARPVGGRVRRQVLFSSVPFMWLDRGARQLELLLAHATGPTRCGPVIVQAFFTEEQIDQAFTDPLFGDVPVDQLTHARATWDACPPAWALLVAHCRVLWRQTAHRVAAS